MYIVNSVKVGYNIFVMNEAYPTEQNNGDHEQFPPYALIKYFQNQFADGYAKQASEVDQVGTEANGEFVRGEPIEQKNSITRGSDRIILKPPHPRDLAGFFTEVYAIFNKSEAHIAGDNTPGAHARVFVVRDFIKGRPSPFFLVDEDGAIRIDIFEEDIISATDDNIIPDSIGPIERAEAMYREYRHCNIVASID